MKKGVLFIASIIGLLFLNIFLVQADTDDLSEGLEENIEDLETKKQDIETKWDYLGEEWKNILLKNNLVLKVNSFFKKISLVFEVLVAEPYTFSVTLLVIILFWIYFFFKIKEIAIDYFRVSSGISYVIGFGASIALSHIGVIRKITEFFAWIAFSQEAEWLRWLFIIVMVGVLIFIYKASSMFGDAYQKSVEELEKEQEKMNRKTLSFLVNSLMRGIKGK